jgi:hypothetical protein
LAISSALRSSPKGSCRDHSKHPRQLHCEFRLRLEPYPAKPSRPTTAGQLLPWALGPFSTSRIEGPLPAGFACPLRSALRVWLPSRRLPPFEPLPALFHTGGAHGTPPSELSPPERCANVSAHTNPPTVPPGVAPATHSNGPDRRVAVPGLRPFRESLAAGHVVSTPDHRMLPWGSPFQGLPARNLARDSAPAPLTHLAGHRISRPRPACAPESQSASA